MAAQEELLRSSTLAAVGRLAAGIAHEIGNPLGAVRGYIDILSKPGIAPDDEAEILERAGKEASRMDSIVRGFLDISRSPRKPAAPVDVNALVEDAVSTVTVLKDFEGVEVLRSLGQGIPKVIIDDGKLRQVIMNILINAAQAMKGVAGNKLVTVETVVESHPVDSSQRRRRRKDDQPALFSDALHEEKEFVAVKVADTGAGISDEDSKKIFEPFFTTKNAGSGTGLGLFVSNSIIKAYGGDIIFRTQAGQGSCFSVILPSWRG
ncbi:MAG: ATP-binding protein, partial [Deltaproteobacteria bacterium]